MSRTHRDRSRWWLSVRVFFFFVFSLSFSSCRWRFVKNLSEYFSNAQLPPQVSSRDVDVSSFLSQASFSCCNSTHDTLFTPVFIGESGWVVVRLVYPDLFVCLVISHGGSTGIYDDVQLRTVHLDCGVMIKSTSVSPN